MSLDVYVVMTDNLNKEYISSFETTIEIEEYLQAYEILQKSLTE